MATAEIAAAIGSISAKKDSLRETFEALKSFSSAAASFTLQWKDLDDHLSSIQRSIELRFKELQSLETTSNPTPSQQLENSAAKPTACHPPESPSSVPLQADPEATTKSTPSQPVYYPFLTPRPVEPEAPPRSELLALCTNMDGKGLRLFMTKNRKDILQIRAELAPAIRAAPDPAKLVLDALDGFFLSKSKAEKKDKDGELQATRRTCLNLLERVMDIAPVVKPAVKEEAKRLAWEWKGRMSDDRDNLQASGFLQLLAAYGLVSEFKVDEIFDVVVLIARRKQTVELCRTLGLTERVPDLIQKLDTMGKQLDAVKFIYGFNLVEKFPPVPFLKAYLKETRKAAQEVRNRGTIQSENDATVKEVGALRAVIKAVEDYKLESEYPCEDLLKLITQLEQQKAQRKRIATDTAASTSKAQHQQKRHRQQPNKRPRQSTTTMKPAISAYSLPPRAQNQSQVGLTDRASYVGLANSYGLAGPGSFYDHMSNTPSGMTADQANSYGLAGPGSFYDHVSNTPSGMTADHLPPSAYLYSSNPYANSANPGYDRQHTYADYPLSGSSAVYGVPRYP